MSTKLPKGYRYQIVGRRATKISRTGDTGGYDILVYKPHFGGMVRVGSFMNKENAMIEVRRIRKTIERDGW
jgi:hypothetical protein